MIDLKEVNDTIKALENGSTSFDTCNKLASLYIVRQNFIAPKTSVNQSHEEATTKEFLDILPQYRIYRATKKKYQKNELSDKAVKTAIKDVCKEIFEFMEMLYSGTDMEEERIEISKLIDDLKTFSG